MRVITIGRSSSNDIVIADTKVSRVHLQLVQNDRGDFSVVDLNSVNGTYVNGIKINGEAQLQANDSLRIGDTVIEWQKYFTGSDNPGGMQPTKPKRIWIWIVINVVLLLAGGVCLYIFQTKTEQKIRDQYKEKEERLHMEAEQKEARITQDKEDEELYKQELRQARDKNRDLAAKKQRDAENARKQVAEANKAKQEAEDARVYAESQILEANQQKEAAEVARSKAEKDASASKTAEAEAKRAKAKVESEYKLAMDLSRKFSSKEYEITNKQTAIKVCEQLNKDVPKDKDAKAYLNELFYDSDNKGRQQILAAIKNVKQGKVEVEQAETSTIKQSSPVEENNQ